MADDITEDVRERMEGEEPDLDVRDDTDGAEPIMTLDEEDS